MKSKRKSNRNNSNYKGIGKSRMFIRIFFLIFAVLFMIPGYSFAEDNNDTPLVIYYSRSGKTRLRSCRGNSLITVSSQWCQE